MIVTEVPAVSAGRTVTITAERILARRPRRADPAAAHERGEWELPGGRLEIGETPEQCVAREIAEETGWAVTAGPILDAWLYHIAQAGRHVLIVTYACRLDPGQEDLNPVLSAEHQRIGLFSPAEITSLVMPQGYKASIATWLAGHAPATVGP
jgi:8-oxo-dGTP pyrophosphatase MutT (NUDIX family)